jgi:3-hydroxyacyl-[acyl-carrier-protein] dehydratase
MRWFWVDRFTEFVSGSHACGVKNVALDEDVLDEYCIGFPCLPPTLIIEGMAQIGGILVAEHFHWEKRVVLAKVAKALFHRSALPGDQLRYSVRLEAVQNNGATITAKSHCDGQLQAEIDLMFAFLEQGRFAEGSLYYPGDLAGMLRIMNVFNVATDARGNPLEISDKI